MSVPPATYNPAQLTALDRLRYLLGDTNISVPWILLDATYTAALAQQLGDERLTAILLADGLIAQFALLPTSMSNSTGESIAWSNYLIGWRALVARLRGEIAAAAVSHAFDVLRPYRPGLGDDRAEYRRECGDVDGWW